MCGSFLRGHQEAGPTCAAGCGKRAPMENKLMHRVQAARRWGSLAARYGSTVKMIQQASGLAGTMLSVRAHAHRSAARAVHAVPGHAPVVRSTEIG